MTPAELKAAMNNIVSRHQSQLIIGMTTWEADPEVGHVEADKLMVATLRALGYGEAMNIYEAQTRWYA